VAGAAVDRLDVRLGLHRDDDRIAAALSVLPGCGAARRAGSLPRRGWSADLPNEPPGGQPIPTHLH
jgi:hypothetical protein